MTQTVSVEASIRKILAPVLRAEGFRGSGRTFRRVANDFVCIVNVQGSRYGGQFAINLGLHPLALAGVVPSRKAIDLKKMSEYDCVFRRRLSSDGADKWWTYSDQTSLEMAMGDAVCLFEAVGRNIFDKHTAPDAPLKTITSAEYKSHGIDLSGLCFSEPLQAYTIALMRLLAGHHDEAIAFAQFALNRVEGASILKKELEAIMDDVWRL
ncbi:MAG: DUF4304 domain-containing protein [Asticcacaulis sp.]|uniref:DUF4304 domain-containing protein n=1 Tax=Asticcacaulis sp. TaxID=1872648 RepID=UPI003F7B4196